ncbi:hypothetical protein BD324DRAFT_638421 [Kockovaella imperatae]|uniref:Zn(2)-C6 fungal-type domain-containing protein n=1 Tax=Kockovaella imperatae TaxID=4999 RepID=A0A1Y1U6S4_9TREE|nr:hypothetical protein BD324DRAFT_638421 [Kockovaella imperatae]ORX33743.1 hypothetical protein BD324DRAFT_638421 [Kockovaella imperatae]
MAQQQDYYPGASVLHSGLGLNGQIIDHHAQSAGLSSMPSAPSVLRKQNVACDACRAKKVRCQRSSTAERCAQCINKEVECTSHYIEQLQSKARRARRKTGGDAESGQRKRSRQLEGGDVSTPFDDPVALLQEVSMATLQSSLGDTNGETSRAGRERMNALQNPLTKRPSERRDNLLRYLFSPTPITHYDFGYTDISSVEQCASGTSDLWEEDGGRLWAEAPSQAHSNVSEADVTELADDLFESYFSIAHPRFPAFNPDQFKAQYQEPDTHPDGPVDHALLAVSIAFGARFSDHPVIESDRAECTARDESEFGAGIRPPRSRIVQLLVVRAREVVEAQKSHRVRKLLNALILVNLESLLGQIPTLGDRYVPYHYQAAVKHVIVLGYNSPESLLAIKDEKERATAVYAWWMICLVDGFRSVFHRLPSSLNEINYTAPDLPEGVLDKAAGPFGEQADHAVVWFSAASMSSALCRDLSRGLWNATAMKEGIRIASLRSYIASITTWKDKYLATLGVPEKVPDDWDFLNAITATGSDTYLHALWLVIERAIKDFGIYELKRMAEGESVSVDPDHEEIRQKIKEESERAATRINGLISVLKENSYLRLDPLVLYQPICEAGWYFASQGRAECQTCVDGLKQYSLAYPSFWDTALNMERMYALQAGANANGKVERQSFIDSTESNGGHGHVTPLETVPITITGLGYSTLPGSIPRELSQDAGAILSGFVQQR